MTATSPGPADFWAHGAGTRATAICRLEVMAPHESEPGRARDPVDYIVDVTATGS